MKPISWKSYYDKFYDWEENTQKNWLNSDKELIYLSTVS